VSKGGPRNDYTPEILAAGDDIMNKKPDLCSLSLLFFLVFSILVRYVRVDFFFFGNESVFQQQ